MSEYVGEYVVSLTAKTFTDLRFYRHEEIVRCRDCKHAFKVTWPNRSKVPPDYLDCQGELVETWDYYADEPKCNPVPPDGYCAWGDRKEGGE